MQEYDRNFPLFLIHIPKTAGASVNQVFGTWFGDRFLPHYYDESAGKMPQKYDLAEIHSREKPAIICGHFNRTRKFGLEDYYPEARQFITILRDPFERQISGYFFVRKHRNRWRDQSRVPQEDLRNHLLSLKSSISDHFPQGISMENYKEMIEKYFVEIGITEHLHESMKRIATRLKQKYDPATLPRFNVTERDQEIPYELREEFIERHPLDFAVYNYALSKYTQQHH